MKQTDFYEDLMSQYYPAETIKRCGIFIKDIESRYLYVNDVLIEELSLIKGKSLTLNDIIGQKDSEFYPHLEAQHFLRVDQAVIESSETLIDEYDFPVNGLKSIYAITEKRPIRTNGQLVGLMGKIHYLNVFQVKGRQVHLSKRELDILMHQVFGFPNKCMAKSLNISIGTISTYCQRIKTKLGYYSQGDLINIINHHDIAPYFMTQLEKYYPPKVAENEQH